MWWTSPFHKSPSSPLSYPRSKPGRILQCTVEQIYRCSSDTDRRKAGRCADIVFQDRTQQPILQQISDIPVQQVVEELVEVFTHFSRIGFNSVWRRCSAKVPQFHLLRRSVRRSRTRTFSTSHVYPLWETLDMNAQSPEKVHERAQCEGVR